MRGPNASWSRDGGQHAQGERHSAGTIVGKIECHEMACGRGAAPGTSCIGHASSQCTGKRLGQWTTLPYLMPINPVHPTLLNNGRVLIVAGSGNVAAETNFRSTIWDPQAGTFSTRSHAWDMFCNGAVVLPDGRVLINGGNQQYDPFRGYRKNAVYDPATDTFTDVENMAHGRWYPTPTVLGDGSVMTFSGLDELTGATNNAVEIYTVGSGWSQEYRRRLDPTSLPAHASHQRRTRLLLRIGPWLQALQPLEQNVVARRSRRRTSAARATTAHRCCCLCRHRTGTRRA